MFIEISPGIDMVLADEDPPSQPAWKAFFKKHQQLFVNLFVFIAIGKWIVEYTIELFNKGELWDFVEISFIIHNIIMLVLILARHKPRDVDRNLFHQAVALVAFFSGLAFEDTPTGNARLILASTIVTIFATIAGTLILLNLGRSFGILIAVRKVETGGFYSLVRHPMYASDIVWKLGMFLKKPSLINTIIMLIGTAAYVYRAVLEERLLSKDPDYAAYMTRVKYRFIPGIF